MIRRGPPNGRARIFGSARLFAGSWVGDCRGVGKLGQHGKRFSQQIVRQGEVVRLKGGKKGGKV